MEFSLLEIIKSVIVINLLSFAVFLFMRKGEKSLHFKYLAAFFISLAINITGAFLFKKEFLHLNYPSLYYMGAGFSYLLGPFVFKYVKEQTSPTEKFQYFDAFHFLPFLIFTTYLAFDFFALNKEAKLAFIQSGKAYTLWMVATLSLHLQLAGYLIFIVRKIKNYGNAMKDYFSSTEKMNYSWLRFIVYGLVALWLTDVTRYINMLTYNFRIGTEIILYVGFLFFCYVLIYKAITQPILHFVDTDKDAPKNQILSDKVSSEYLKTLLSFMQREKPYLDPGITVNDLSNMVSIPQRSLSLVLRSQLEQNFYDFINSYRIKESERLLSDPSNIKTVLEVLYEVGFNSKSSFYEAFKKHHGMTPTQFRKQHSF